MASLRISAYTDKLSVKAGERIEVMASAVGSDTVRASLVRLIHGDVNPAGPGFIEEHVESPFEGDWPAHEQHIQKGNFLRVSDPQQFLAISDAFTLHAYIFPTLVKRSGHVILGNWSDRSNKGFMLAVDGTGHLEFRIGDGKSVGTIRSNVPLTLKTWYFVAATFDPAQGEITLYQDAVINRYNSLHSKIAEARHSFYDKSFIDQRPQFDSDAGFLIGGTTAEVPGRGALVTRCYNGKIDRCGISSKALSLEALRHIQAGSRPSQDDILVYWDTTAGYTEYGIGDIVTDIGPHGLHASGVNRPVRGQTGWNWNGRNDSFRLAPNEYGGIEFHGDALTDCCWHPTFSFQVPTALRSGIYAVKLTVGDGTGLGEEYTPFIVRAQKPEKKICLIVPTASYLAYANIATSFYGSLAESISGTPQVFQEIDIEAYKNDFEFGLSAYDSHEDGAGVCYTSYRRPITNMRPKHRFAGGGIPWQFSADLSLVAWLERVGYEYDVITDEDLHRDGVKALSPYRVVLTATHCEYYSERMMDATEDYLEAGGRFLYLSGNGYYWVVGFRSDEPWIMEIRRLESGTRAWQARPGEHYLASSGERGGLWRHRNRAPQKLLGVGFTSEGMDYCVPYRRMPSSYLPQAAWVFDGVEGEIIGDSGLVGGGAAGIEVDRYDLSLGTPPNARVLAMSEPFSDNYPLAHEDIAITTPGLGGTQNHNVRADMVYFKTKNEGAVFSASSIAWVGSLPCNDFDNSVSRITKNVIDRFLQPGPLPSN